MGHGLCSLKLYPHYLFIGGDLAKLLRSEPAVAFKPPPLQKTVLIGLSKTESSESLKKRDSVYIKDHEMEVRIVWTFIRFIHNTDFCTFVKTSTL